MANLEKNEKKTVENMKLDNVTKSVQKANFKRSCFTRSFLLLRTRSTHKGTQSLSSLWIFLCVFIVKKSAFTTPPYDFTVIIVLLIIIHIIIVQIFMIFQWNKKMSGINIMSINLLPNAKSSEDIFQNILCCYLSCDASEMVEGLAQVNR